MSHYFGFQIFDSYDIIAWVIINRFWLVNKLPWVTNCLFFSYIAISHYQVWCMWGLWKQLFYVNKQRWPIHLDWMMDQSYLIWKKWEVQMKPILMHSRKTCISIWNQSLFEQFTLKFLEILTFSLKIRMFWSTRFCLILHFG